LSEEMAAPRRKAMLEEISNMGEEFKRLEELARVEESGRGTVIKGMKSLLSYLNAPVPVSAGTLLEGYGDIEDIRILAAGDVILRTKSGSIVSNPLERLSQKDFLTLVQGLLTELVRRVAEKSEAAVMAEMPRLSVMTTLEGGRMLLFDWRSFHVHLKNDGGDALTLKAQVMMGDERNAYGPFKVPRGTEVEFDLRKFHGVRSGAIHLDVQCVDATLRGYEGKVTVAPGKKEWDAVTLARLGAGPVDDDRPSRQDLPRRTGHALAAGRHH